MFRRFLLIQKRIYSAGTVYSFFSTISLYLELKKACDILKDFKLLLIYLGKPQKKFLR